MFAGILNWLVYLLSGVLFVFFAEFQGLLYDLMKQAVLGTLEVDDVVSFLTELIEDNVVRFPISYCDNYMKNFPLGDQNCFSVSVGGHLGHSW